MDGLPSDWSANGRPCCSIGHYPATCCPTGRYRVTCCPIGTIGRWDVSYLCHCTSSLVPCGWRAVTLRLGIVPDRPETKITGGEGSECKAPRFLRPEPFLPTDGKPHGKPQCRRTNPCARPKGGKRYSMPDRAMLGSGHTGIPGVTPQDR